LDIEKLLSLALKEGDEQAFGKLHERTYRFVFSVAYSTVRNHALAQDISQATYLILHRRGKGISTEPALMSWLWKTTKLTALRAMRDEKRQQKRDRALLPTASNETETVDNHFQVVQALNCLKDSDRNLVVMRYINENTVEEVARLSRLSVSATQMRLSRALEKIRKHSGLLTVALVISALGAKPALAVGIPAVPTTLTASATALKLAQPSGLLTPLKIAIGSNPFITGGVMSCLAVGGGFTYWYLNTPHYELDRATTAKFDQLFSGRYSGSTKVNGSDGTELITSMIVVIRYDRKRDEMVLRSQDGDREVSTLSFQFAKGRNTFFTEGNEVPYSLTNDTFTCDITQDRYAQFDRKLRTSTFAPGTIHIVLQRVENKLIVNKDIRSTINFDERAELDKKR
jgi:RNA polymerase sigma factor (sigma-70 family)